MIDLALIESAVMIALRFAWPFIGGAAVVSEHELGKIAGYIVAGGAIAYHAYRRAKAKRQSNGQTP